MRLSARRAGLRGVLMAACCGLLMATWSGPAGSARTQDQGQEFLAGRLLVAARGMRDPNFAQTVVFMIEHHDEGALGLVINRPLGEAPLSRLMQGLGMKGEGAKGSVRLHSGGPVRPSSFFILHSPDVAIEETMVVNNLVAVTTQPAFLNKIGEGTGPRHAILVMGYAGWGPGQLEAEIARGDWGNIETDEAVVFDQDYETKWERAIQGVTIDL